jgi:hypothetical protein
LDLSKTICESCNCSRIVTNPGGNGGNTTRPRPTQVSIALQMVLMVLMVLMVEGVEYRLK